MKVSTARIVVQNSFCTNCIDLIKKRMMEVQINNVMLYPSDSLIVFNYKRANQISEALNTLVSLGYPPLGDTIESSSCKMPLCCTCNT